MHNLCFYGVWRRFRAIAVGFSLCVFLFNCRWRGTFNLYGLLNCPFYSTSNDFLFVVVDICKPGWSYFSGVCYSTSQSCKNWTEAQNTCQNYSANLVSIRTQEENVYVQHRLNGARGWIGLNDRNSEGTFVWADSRSNSFTYWAQSQPNDFNNEDCVHTLGIRHGFMWNDVSCASCHNYTCSEGVYW